MSNLEDCVVSSCRGLPESYSKIAPLESMLAVKPEMSKEVTCGAMWSWLLAVFLTFDEFNLLPRTMAPVQAGP